MIKIVLADDEKLIRAGLKKVLLENIEIPLEILEAKNGEEALELCSEKKPDILITDIRMPVMDGVELMQKISAMSQKPKIIVLSGYDEFSYAKAAIQSGAISYILKPVDKKELIGAVNSSIMNAMREEKEQNEHKFRRIMEMGRPDNLESLPEIKIPNGLRCIVIYGKNAEETLQNVMGKKQFYVLEQTNSSILIVYPSDGTDVEYDESLLNGFIIGVSSPTDNYSMMRLMKKQAITAAMQAFFDPKTGKILEEEKRCGIYHYENETHKTDFLALDEAYEKIIGKCDIATTEEMQESIQNLFKCFCETAKINSEMLYYLYRKICSNMFTRYPGYTDTDMYLHIKSLMIENIFDHKHLGEWKTSVLDYAVYLTALLKRNTKEFPYITEALEFIKTHFKKNINMAMVANHVSVNYTWFSEKFKEHTGVNFNEYIKRLRMEEAKVLLQKGCYKVYEVAERSGFSDVKYFMKIFRDETGMSPTEWSNKHSTP